MPTFWERRRVGRLQNVNIPMRENPLCHRVRRHEWFSTWPAPTFSPDWHLTCVKNSVFIRLSSLMWIGTTFAREWCDFVTHIFPSRTSYMTHTLNFLFSGLMSDNGTLQQFHLNEEWLRCDMWNTVWSSEWCVIWQDFRIFTLTGMWSTKDDIFIWVMCVRWNSTF